MSRGGVFTLMIQILLRRLAHQSEFQSRMWYPPVDAYMTINVAVHQIILCPIRPPIWFCAHRLELNRIVQNTFLTLESTAWIWCDPNNSTKWSLRGKVRWQTYWCMYIEDTKLLGTESANCILATEDVLCRHHCDINAMNICCTGLKDFHPSLLVHWKIIPGRFES